MGGKQGRLRQGRHSVPSAMKGGALVLTTGESTRRITKEQFNVVQDAATIRRWMRSVPPSGKGNVCRILLIGKASSGKSALINAIAGEDIAEEAHQRKSGKGVEVYRLAAGEQSLFVVETPGLFDGEDREEGHIADLKSVIGPDAANFHLILFCTPLTTKVTEAALSQEDEKTLNLFTSLIGHELWSRAVVALTFVNHLQQNDQLLQDRLDCCTVAVHACLVKCGVPPHIAKHVPLVPVGFHGGKGGVDMKESTESYMLSNGTDWLHNLWEVICDRVSSEAKTVFKSLEIERFVPLGYVSVDEIEPDQVQ